MLFRSNEFGESVTVCTEFRRDSIVFRCHPKFQSLYPKYDWMRVKVDTGVFPCKLALVVVNDKTDSGSTQFHLIVQSTTQQTSHHGRNGSVLFTEWNWSTEYYTIAPENIVSRCFCISGKDDDSWILEALPYEEWADQFTN